MPNRPRIATSFVLVLIAAIGLAGHTFGRTPQTNPAPRPAGCIAETAAGDHMFTCSGLRVDARIPALCPQPGCGLILELHGDTGTGLLEDAHTRLRELGARDGYIVLAPTGPPFGGQAGSTWSSANDQTLVDIVRQFARVFRVDPSRIHVTGFSRGGFVTWRLACDHADLFASAAPAGASTGTDRGETTCFSGGRVPSRKIPLLLLMGRTDGAVGYAGIVTLRDAAIRAYGATRVTVLENTSAYTHTRWSAPDGAVVETFDHAYETVADGPWGFARGHCVPGSLVDPYARQYALACKPPTAFAWGEEVMTFFRAHPMP